LAQQLKIKGRTGGSFAGDAEPLRLRSGHNTDTACREAVKEKYRLGTFAQPQSPRPAATGGGMQMLVEDAIDLAGNVCASNNWQDPTPAISRPRRV
jgi:hypothetical protein